MLLKGRNNSQIKYNRDSKSKFKHKFHDKIENYPYNLSLRENKEIKRELNLL